VRGLPSIALAAVLLGSPALAAGTGLVFVTNEKSNTISVLGPGDEVVETIETCARPRGIAFSADRTQFLVGCADDSVIVAYDAQTRQLVRRYRGIEEPETFWLHPDGRHLYISNEEDAAATVLDLESGEIVASYDTGEEPEGVLATSDGRYVFVASEAANLVHVIDVAAGAVVADILVDTRPRRFALTRDERQLWVSAELSGVVNIVELETFSVIDTIPFLPRGFRREQVTPVDLLITKDGSRAYVALGRANHVAVVDVPSRQVTDYILTGSRPWGLALSSDESKLYVANGLSDDISIIDTATLRVVKSVPVGQIPYGILIDDR
jgi:PQQ-dependent catabolism-associated beta-propeller protein